MKVTINLEDAQIIGFIHTAIDEQVAKVDIDKIVAQKIDKRVSDVVEANLSKEKMENFLRDRISRVVTTESLKEYSSNVDTKDVFANLETKILLMIGNSKEFKTLVKETLKNSL